MLFAPRSSLSFRARPAVFCVLSLAALLSSVSAQTTSQTQNDPPPAPSRDEEASKSKAAAERTPAELLKIVDQLESHGEITSEKAAEYRRNLKLAIRNRLWKHANQLQQSGKPAEALVAASQVLSIDQELFGPDHDEVNATWRFITELHEEQNDFEAAHVSGSRF